MPAKQRRLEGESPVVGQPHTEIVLIIANIQYSIVQAFEYLRAD